MLCLNRHDGVTGPQLSEKRVQVQYVLTLPVVILSSPHVAVWSKHLQHSAVLQITNRRNIT